MRNQEQVYALGRMKTGRQNKTEAAYERHLEALRHAGEIVWFAFEAMKFRLADNTFYTPDFIVMRPGGLIEAHEVKGFWTDDARVKIKVAADRFPLRFVAVRKSKGGWDMEAFE